MPRKSTKVPRPCFSRRGAGSGNETSKAGSICIGEHYLGPEIAAVIRVAAKQGFLMKGDAIGTRVSVRYRRSGRLS